MSQDTYIQFLEQQNELLHDENHLLAIVAIIMGAGALILIAVAWRLIVDKDIKPNETKPNPRNPFADSRYSRDGRTINPEWVAENRHKYPEY